MINKKLCEFCHKPMSAGRSDKRFCDAKCKNEFNAQVRAATLDDVRRVDAILHKNHRILRSVMQGVKAQKKMILRLELAELGFDFGYITGVYLNRQGKQYHYIYDFAWMAFSTQEIMVVQKTR